MKTKIAILLVDDHALVRRGFRRLIEDEADLEVIGEAGDGAEAIEMSRKLEPQVVVMDYALPQLNGALAARRILASHPSTAILMLSMHAEASYVRNSLDAGVRGYLLKNAMDLELVDSIRRVAGGEQVLDPHLPAASVSACGSRGLTMREIEVLQHIVGGLSNKEIAARLELSVNTVSVHRARIMEHLGIHNTAGLVVYAIRNGLVTLP
jgi:DNA-binding NarL/FixJ family response regulator